MKFPVNPFTIIGAMLTVMVAWGSWEFERALNRLDAIETNTGQDHTQITVSAGDIADLKPRVGALEDQVGNLDHRVTRLEPR